MPKMLVLFHSRFGKTAVLAEAVADGARSVRFSEVTVRRIGGGAPLSVIDSVPGWKQSYDAMASRYAILEDIHELTDYDGIILGSPLQDGALATEATDVIERAGSLVRSGAFLNTVGSGFTSPPPGKEGLGAAWSIVASLAQLGMIIVPGATDASQPSAAMQHGKRVAEVVSWITHAKSHAHHH